MFGRIFIFCNGMDLLGIIAIILMKEIKHILKNLLKDLINFLENFFKF